MEPRATSSVLIVGSSTRCVRARGELVPGGQSDGKRSSPSPMLDESRRRRDRARSAEGGDAGDEGGWRYRRRARVTKNAHHVCRGERHAFSANDAADEPFSGDVLVVDEALLEVEGALVPPRDARRELTSA